MSAVAFQTSRSKSSSSSSSAQLKLAAGEVEMVEKDIVGVMSWVVREILCSLKGVGLEVRCRLRIVELSQGGSEEIWRAMDWGEWGV